MKLDENFTLESTADSWILYFESKKLVVTEEGTKEVITSRQTYHATLPQALRAYVNESLKIPESIVEVSKKIIELNEKIDNLFIEFKRK